jgi:hypothetical protein
LKDFVDEGRISDRAYAIGDAIDGQKILYLIETSIAPVDDVRRPHRVASNARGFRDATPSAKWVPDRAREPLDREEPLRDPLGLDIMIVRFSIENMRTFRALTVAADRLVAARAHVALLLGIRIGATQPGPRQMSWRGDSRRPHYFVWSVLTRIIEDSKFRLVTHRNPNNSENVLGIVRNQRKTLNQNDFLSLLPQL